MTVQTMTAFSGQRDTAISILFDAPRSSAFVRLSGDVDLSDTPTLTAAYDQVVKARPQVIWLDLAEVTFAGSTLVNFLLRLRNALPEETRFAVCRPTWIASRVLTVCHLENRMQIHDTLPDNWPHPVGVTC